MSRIIHKLMDNDDIRRYINGVRLAEVFLNIDRTPIIGKPFEGTTDEFSLDYILDEDVLIKEVFLEVRTKNITNKPLIKGRLDKNVYPIQKNALENVWAQIGYRMGFMDKKNIKNTLYIPDHIHVDFKKKLPDLPYSIKINLTLDKVMEFAKENFIDYERFKFLWDNPEVVGVTPEDLILTYH